MRADGDRLRFRPKEAVTPDLMEVLKQYKAEIITALTAPAVPARVRGQDGVAESTNTEPCWHCKGEKSCRCALCAVARPGTGWGKGSCRACSGTGHLAWPSTIQ